MSDSVGGDAAKERPLLQPGSDTDDGNASSSSSSSSSSSTRIAIDNDNSSSSRNRNNNHNDNNNSNDSVSEDDDRFTDDDDDDGDDDDNDGDDKTANEEDNEEERRMWNHEEHVVLYAVSQCLWVFRTVSFMVFGTLLTVFVPQMCTARDSGVPNDKPHECSLDENIAPLGPINAFCLFWNIISLLVLCLHYVLMMLRERFIRQTFGYEWRAHRLHLRTHMHEIGDTHVQRTLHSWNTWLYRHSVWLGVCQIINFIASTWFILGYYNAGYKSASALLLNALIVGTMVYRSVQNGLTGMKIHVAFSSFNMQPFSYNIVLLSNTTKTGGGPSGRGVRASASGGNRSSVSQPGKPV